MLQIQGHMMLSSYPSPITPYPLALPEVMCQPAPWNDYVGISPHSWIQETAPFTVLGCYLVHILSLLPSFQAATHRSEHHFSTS